MTQGQQPEALRLANALAYCDSSVASQAAAELRRLHAENVTLQQGYDAARLEIDSLQARVQELGAMLRENRSKRIVELEAQLEAIGAGGVEPLRRRECLHQISEPETASQPPAGWVMVPELPDERMERAIAGAFCGTVYEARKAWESGIAAAPKATPVPVVEQEELRDGASYESMNLAVMVLSDCGHSSNYKPLLERVAGRIDRHVERLLTAQHADRAMRAQAAPAAGDWINAREVQSLVRELDVALNGERGAAPQASLCDVVGQVKAEAVKLGRPVLEAPSAVAEPSDFDLRKLWREAGGTFYGPHVETGAMEESKLLPFLRSLATQPAPSHPDDAAVDAMAAAMKAKLAKQRAKGYGGWDTPECTQQRLSDMLRAHVDKGDPVDVANFCAFLAARGEGIAQAAPAAQGDADFEAVRKKLCELQRYSFVLDDDGVVRRVQDRTGNWIEFDAAHELLDPVAVDAARSQAKEGA